MTLIRRKRSIDKYSAAVPAHHSAAVPAHRNWKWGLAEAGIPAGKRRARKG
jgi:hypothetical protein